MLTYACQLFTGICAHSVQLLHQCTAEHTTFSQKNMVDLSNSRVYSCMEGEYLKYILKNEVGAYGVYTLYFIVTSDTMRGRERSNENSSCLFWVQRIVMSVLKHH